MAGKHEVLSDVFPHPALVAVADAHAVNVGQDLPLVFAPPPVAFGVVELVRDGFHDLPFDEEEFPKDGPYAPDAQNYPVRQGNMPNLSAPAPTDDDAPEWVTSHEAPAKPSSIAPKAEAKAAYITAYLDLLGYVKAHSGLKDEVAIQAATATLHIGLKQEGLR